MHKEAKQKALVDYGNVLKDGNHSDVVLCVGGHQFKAHKIILAARSPVFSAMFNHETKELLESRVDIHDINLEVFNDFLKYIYTGDINLSEADIVGLFIAADMVCYFILFISHSINMFLLYSINWKICEQ